LLKIQENETPTDFEYTDNNYVKKIFIATQEFELVEQAINYIMSTERRRM
jgi:hypothetical protein